MSVSRKIKTTLERASWIRRMFEEGAELKARLGADKVYDFTLGNPDLEPPPRFKEALVEVARDPSPGLHGYMPNAGLLEARKALAGHLSGMYQRDFRTEDLVLTCGAAGALNVIFKTLLDPGDEVVIFAPYFPEYQFYADNHGGTAIVAETGPSFQLDLKALQQALSPRTKAVLINSPNNPTGQVYPAPALTELGHLLKKRGEQEGRVIYLIADEPYSRILFDGLELPNIFSVYPHTILATSFSKDLSLAGERIGWLAVHPDAEGAEELVNGAILCNRILGFVNAPALQQRLVEGLLDVQVDLAGYAAKRARLLEALEAAGYACVRPEGAFYMFPAVPGGMDDVAFVNACLEERLLVVPGSGFGRPGHFRISYAVTDRAVDLAVGALGRVARRVAAS